MTIEISVDRDGNIFEDTQCHGNSWAEVYRGKVLALERMKFLVNERRVCPFNPKNEAPSLTPRSSTPSEDS